MLNTGLAAAAVPHLIRYQGQAVDSNNVPLNGSYTLTFRLYDAETDGNELWKEKQEAVELVDGHFSVLLGQNNPQQFQSIDWSQPLWLSVQVNEGLADETPELHPRQRITSVPLAIRAASAEQLTEPITPALIDGQGAGGGLDADTVDGNEASNLLSRANHTGVQAPSTISPQGAGSGLDADTVDGLDASTFALTGHTHGSEIHPSIRNFLSGCQMCVKFMTINPFVSCSNHGTFCAPMNNWTPMIIVDPTKSGQCGYQWKLQCP